MKDLFPSLRLLFPFLSLLFPSLMLVGCLPVFGQPGALVWEDNFNTGTLDTSKWFCETGTGVNGDWGTGQVDRATDRIENVSFRDDVPGAEDGCLVITTRREFYIDRNYTSARILSAGKASWGPRHKIVARVYPRDVRYMGQGFAFWMMPDELPAGWSYLMWPQGGEIDIMEYVGAIPFHNLGSVHYAWFWDNNQWKDWNHGYQGAYYSFEEEEVPYPSEPGYGNYPPDANDPYAGSSGFHTYGINWYDGRMEFFVDDHIYHIHYFNDGGGFEADGEDESGISYIDDRRVASSEYSHHFDEWHPFEHKMFAILSGGVGGSDWSYGGAVVPSVPFPCSVFIDWVRVYQLGYPVSADEADPPPGFEVFPNPAQDHLQIRVDKGEEYYLRIADLSGKTVLSTRLDQSSSVDISALRPGMYLVLVKNGGISFSKQIIIR